MKGILLGVVGISALFIAAPLSTAGAADLALKAPPAPPAAAYNWTGCYVGGNAGGAWGNSNVEIPLYPAPYNNLNINDASVIGGAQIGCNYMFSNRWVVGIEGDWDWTRLNGSTVTGSSGLETYYTDFNSVASVRGRLGYGWDRTLLYVTGGGAWSNLQAANYIETGPPCLPAPPSFLGCTTHSATFGGWTAGVGIEYALTQNWIVGAEYLYAGFGRIDFVYNGPTNVSESISQLRARVSFKF